MKRRALTRMRRLVPGGGASGFGQPIKRWLSERRGERMSSDAAILLCVVGLGLIGAIIAIGVMRSRRAGTRVASKAAAREMSPGERLLAHSRDRNDYRLFVGFPPARPARWVEVAELGPFMIKLLDSTAIASADVTAYFVAYSSGVLVDCHNPGGLPLPHWTSGISASALEQTETLTEADLEEGRALVQVLFGRSTSHPGSRDHYSTALVNLSCERVRVLKFGGYSRRGETYVLNTVTHRFFTASDFLEWYGARGKWIEPGQTVIDPNN